MGAYGMGLVGKVGKVEGNVVSVVVASAEDTMISGEVVSGEVHSGVNRRLDALYGDQSSKPLFFDHAVSLTTRNYGHIDIIVSNAAANPSIDNILNTKESVLDKLWEINVKATILLLQDAASHLRKGSSVIIISSIAGYQPEASLAMYGVTKTALLGLTKALAAEMSPETRVNCIAPGFVPTHFADFLTTNEAIRKSIEEKTLMKRLGTTEDMAAAAAFLASDDASYITAETIVVAGGMPSRL
ncbi:Tropinone reductase-like 3 [Ananas comosus]|uniref:Tropinone reductase-like 3 n=1 Tax=Ananas comosus TaxID=4615 RepID=A0A199VVV4_ANACO|nr:Tropinone reductase-like 3 [Ananas comosus]